MTYVFRVTDHHDFTTVAQATDIQTFTGDLHTLASDLTALQDEIKASEDRLSTLEQAVAARIAQSLQSPI